MKDAIGCVSSVCRVVWTIRIQLAVKATFKYVVAA